MPIFSENTNIFDNFLCVIGLSIRRKINEIITANQKEADTFSSCQPFSYIGRFVSFVRDQGTSKKCQNTGFSADWYIFVAL